jgi:hypothetical protein
VDTQTTILIGFAALFVAGLTVSIGGWVLFARERRATRRDRRDAAAEARR